MKLEIGVQDKILVVAPHPDDESIGCGGLLALYGEQCDVLLLTDGRQGVPSDYNGQEDICMIRRRELEQALKIAGVTSVQYLDAPDGSLKKEHGGLEKIDLTKYTHIFVPNPWENHEDHRAAYKLIKQEKRRQHAKGKLLQYEVWTVLREPDYFLDISGVIHKKREMIKSYVSQLKDKDYLNAALGLSAYRGMFPGYEYAEAYASCGWKYWLWTKYNRFSPEFKNMIRKYLRH